MAYWDGSGSGAGVATTGVLAAPTGVTVPTTSGGDVPVSWTPPAGAAVDGYYVTRDSGSGPVAACGASRVTAASCTDSGLGDGTYTYVVTAVSRSWTATSAPSGAVTVVTTSQAFTTQPSETSVGAVMTPAVEVTIKMAGGTPVAGASITVSIGANPSGGTLSGTTTAVTDADGVATFSGLSIDKTGTGYTLTAASPGLAPTTSATFSVVPGPTLGRAGNFSVLGGTGVVNTLATTVSGDLGVSPSSAVTGFPPGTVAGTIHAGDPAAAQAQTDLVTALAGVAARTPDTGFAGDLNGRTFYAGVHHTGAALALTGTLTLDAQNNPNAVFIFQVGAALDTAAASRVLLVNGARASNVFWQVTGAAGTGANSSFAGTIMASGAITLGAGSTLIGRALSQGTVTLASNTIRFTEAMPPTITITPATTDVTKSPTPTITGTTDAAVGMTVTVTVAGVLSVADPPMIATTQMLSTTVQAGGTWSVTATTLAAWRYVVEAKVRDSAGNGGVGLQNLTVEVSPLAVDLGSAASYAVLGGTGVASTGATSVGGDLGVSPSTSVIGFPPGTVAGAIHAGDQAAAQAQTDLMAALADATSRSRHTEFAGDLNGRTFHAGVHRTVTALALTGTVVLDAQENPDAVFVFQIDAALNTAASSTVVLANGARASNVFWQVTGAAGTGANSSFVGTIMATGSITLGADSRLNGRALSQGVVTLAGNTITQAQP